MKLNSSSSFHLVSETDAHLESQSRNINTAVRR